jgi:hypothetical protein
MALANYSDLKASVANWLNRSDLAAAIPDFIALAEAQISRRLVMAGPVRAMMGRSDAVVDGEFAAVPADFMGARSMQFAEDRTCVLEYCLPEQIGRKKSMADSAMGRPRFFSVVGGEFQFFPAPGEGASYTAELTYWKRLPALSDANPSNWLLALHPDAYLYGALLQSAPYLKDDARIQGWGTFFQTILADIVATDRIERDSTFQAVTPPAHGAP